MVRSSSPAAAPGAKGFFVSASGVTLAGMAADPSGAGVGRVGLTRAVARISNEYVLRSLRLLTDLHGGEFITAIVCQAIIAANTAHLADQLEAAASWGHSLPPDSVRKPVSILAVAGSLGLPFETTRRHVSKLIAAGACKRVRGGVIVPAEVLDTDANYAAAETNAANVQRFIRALRRAGLPID